MPTGEITNIARIYKTNYYAARDYNGKSCDAVVAAAL
jgi:hypothetical protein